MNTLTAIMKPRPTPYFDLIAEATGARLHQLPVLERIMREEIFHSTLDWQTREQFIAGAREAHLEYQSAKEFYDAEHTLIVIGFFLSKTEAKLAEATKKLERATARGFPDRIAKCQTTVTKLTAERDNLARQTESWTRITKTWLDFFFPESDTAKKPA